MQQLLFHSFAQQNFIYNEKRREKLCTFGITVTGSIYIIYWPSLTGIHFFELVSHISAVQIICIYVVICMYFAAQLIFEVAMTDLIYRPASKVHCKIDSLTLIVMKYESQESSHATQHSVKCRIQQVWKSATFYVLILYIDFLFAAFNASKQ